MDFVLTLDKILISCHAKMVKGKVTFSHLLWQLCNHKYVGIFETFLLDNFGLYFYYYSE